MPQLDLHVARSRGKSYSNRIISVKESSSRGISRIRERGKEVRIYNQLLKLLKDTVFFFFKKSLNCAVWFCLSYFFNEFVWFYLVLSSLFDEYVILFNLFKFNIWLMVQYNLGWLSCLHYNILAYGNDRKLLPKFEKKNATY